MSKISTYILLHHELQLGIYLFFPCSHIKSALSCLFTLGLDVSKVFRKIGRLTRQLHLYHQVALEVVMLRTSMLEVLTAAATTMIEGVN